MSRAVSCRAHFLAIAGTLLLRAALLAGLGGSALSDDAADYHRMSGQLASGLPFEPEWPPGLPLYLWPFEASFRAFGASSIVADRVAMLVAWLAFAVLIHGLARRVAGERAGLAAVIGFGLFPSFVYASVTPLTQLPAAALLVGAVWAALALLDAPASERVPRLAVLVGLALGALVLVRPSAVLLAVAAPFLLAWATRRLAVLFVPALVSAALVGAWTVHAHGLTGRWMFVNAANSQNVFYGNNPWTPRYRTWWFGSHKQGEPGVPDEFVAIHRQLAQTSPERRDAAFSDYALAHIRARPDLFVVRSLSRARTYFAYDTFTAAQLRRRPHLALAVEGLDAAFYIGMLGLGTAWMFARDARRVGGALALAVLLYAAPYFVTFSHPTYHFPVVPLFGVAAAAWVAARPAPLVGRRRALFWLVAAAFVAVQLEWTLDLARRV